uniref:Uncharacterized protein n=1 Tax=Arundo donax TaxID=35708 RepID=A0A0A9GXV8_ARUDO
MLEARSQGGCQEHSPGEQRIVCDRGQHFSHRCNNSCSDTLRRSQYSLCICSFKRGSCDCWHHQEANLLRIGSDQAGQGRDRGRGQGEAQDGLRPSSI